MHGSVGERADTDRYYHQIEIGGTGGSQLRISLHEESRVSIDDPARDLLVAIPCGVLDQQVALAGQPRVLGRGTDNLVVGLVELHQLSPFSRDGGLGGRGYRGRD